MPDAIDRATINFRDRYRREPNVVVRAPGRVNLIGEHTDYNDGFVLPMALPFAVAIAAEVCSGTIVHAHSEGFDATEFDLSHPVAEGGWQAYVHGTASILADEGHAVGAWQGCIASDIPGGASLSSSAALEVAAGLAFVTAGRGEIDHQALARVGQRVENEVLGLPSGILDQLASATGVEGAASLIDCRDLSSAVVPLPDGTDIVIMDTGTRRKLVESEYAARQADCQEAAAQLGVPALRDATLSDLDRLGDARLLRRARHVITENQRTLDAAKAMHINDLVGLGQLMNASHASLRDDYNVSGPALDHIVALAQQTPGCLGARMTGGGFAGAAVALVESTATASFVDSVTTAFSAPPAQPADDPVRLYAVRPAAGASIITRP